MLLSKFIDLVVNYWYFACVIGVIFLAVIILIISAAVRRGKAKKSKVEEQKVISEINAEAVKPTEEEKPQEKAETKNVACDAETSEESVKPVNEAETVSEKNEAVKEQSDGTDESKDETASLKSTGKGGTYRVIFDKENREWMVKKDNASRVIRRVRTKEEALKLAKQFAENQDMNLQVQKKDGKFQKKSNY